MLLIVALIAVALLAFANGANDNFKGVATLFGSGTTDYRRALAWATLTTLGGSCAAIYFGADLLARFSGKGLVPDTALADSRFAVSVIASAGLTVLAATRLGLPISTTHALVGAMAGTATAANAGVDWKILGSAFLLPLLLSPLIALTLTVVVYLGLRRMRRATGIRSDSCLCFGETAAESAVVALRPHATCITASSSPPKVTAILGRGAQCRLAFTNCILAIEMKPALDVLHFISAGVVSFARGVNDTPKIAALLLVSPMIKADGALLLCGGVIALGGIITAGRVAETMSHRITTMNAGQGLSANLITGLLVLFASRWGLPVSTTHVSCGSLFGIGFMNGESRRGLLFQVLLAWIATLPSAFALGWSAYRLFLSSSILQS